MDVIRAGLETSRSRFLGISYGTYLGRTYATLFPDHVRAMVLDSAFEPTGDTVEEQYLTQLVGFENAFDNWAAWCEADESCAFRADDVGARWDELDRSSTTSRSPEGTDASPPVHMTPATTAALYSETDGRCWRVRRPRPRGRPDDHLRDG